MFHVVTNTLSPEIGFFFVYIISLTEDSNIILSLTLLNRKLSCFPPSKNRRIYLGDFIIVDKFAIFLTSIIFYKSEFSVDKVSVYTKQFS